MNIFVLIFVSLFQNISTFLGTRATALHHDLRRLSAGLRRLYFGPAVPDSSAILVGSKGYILLSLLADLWRTVFGRTGR